QARTSSRVFPLKLRCREPASARPLGRVLVLDVNKLVAGMLSEPIARVACAAALASVPQAHRSLNIVRPPAGDAFAAFGKALGSMDPEGPTRCAGWTVHELTAHLAAGSAELADLIELELGSGSRPTRDFDDREAPYRALAPARLRRAFFEESLR